MDRAIAGQFGPEHFVTARMMRLNVATGHLQWVNAGHPAPLLIRNHQVVRQLRSPITLPVGFGGDEPQLSEQTLQVGDRVLCFTDGLIEEHDVRGKQFGEEQLITWVNRIEHAEEGVRAVARSLSHTLPPNPGGRPNALAEHLAARQPVGARRRRPHWLRRPAMSRCRPTVVRPLAVTLACHARKPRGLSSRYERVHQAGGEPAPKEYAELAAADISYEDITEGESPATYEYVSTLPAAGRVPTAGPGSRWSSRASQLPEL